MMGWRIKTNAEEWDAVSARHYIKRMGRAGIRSRLKRQMRRRDRYNARYAVCSTCNGRGYDSWGEPFSQVTAAVCPDCLGEGYGVKR